MKQRLLNLAESPFTNERPVHRMAVLLWILGVGLLVLNVMLYQRHISSQQQRSTAIESIESRRAEAQVSIQELQKELSGLNLAKQNRQIEFLNSQIAKRTFSWSRLIDRLAEVLPNTVQLRGVTPKVNDPGDPDTVLARLGTGQTVTVEIVGESSSGESILAFVDSLFEHPSFVAPKLLNESRRKEDLNQFSLRVFYLPDRDVEVTADE